MIWGRQKAEGRRQKDAQAMCNASVLSNPRFGFTLVELLVVILIIAILSGLVLGVAAVAAESGREARTKQMITRLHTLLMERYDEYRNRRVEINDASLSGVPLARKRLAAAREQMKMEMPDRWSDILLPMPSDPLPISPSDLLMRKPQHLQGIPSLTQIYRRQYERQYTTGNVTTDNLLDNQSAECLYMVIMYATGDGEARAQFKETDFADTDGDGFPEFVDGWGRPIQFLRWAPGYVSETQLSPQRLAQIVKDETGVTYNPQSPSDEAIDVITRTIRSDRDPFDLFGVDRPFDDQNPFAANGTDKSIALRGYRLMPLIYSAGRDEEYGIRVDGGYRADSNDPYFFDTDTGASGDNQLGDALDGTSTDNITNHLITAE